QNSRRAGDDVTRVVPDGAAGGRRDRRSTGRGRRLLLRCSAPPRRLVAPAVGRRATGPRRRRRPVAARRPDGRVWEGRGAPCSYRRSKVIAMTTTSWPASSVQESMWLAERMEPDSALYNVPMAWRVEGRLDTGILRLALAMVVERHEILHTAFIADD